MARGETEDSTQRNSWGTFMQERDSGLDLVSKGEIPKRVTI